MIEKTNGRMLDNFHSVETLCNEGNRFVQKHQLEGAAANLGALTWGLLRALYECPNCPATFREPRMSTIGIEVLWCPKCGGQWIHEDDLAKAEALQKPEQPALFAGVEVAT